MPLWWTAGAQPRAQPQRAVGGRHQEASAPAPAPAPARTAAQQQTTVDSETVTPPQPLTLAISGSVKCPRRRKRLAAAAVWCQFAGALFAGVIYDDLHHLGPRGPKRRRTVENRFCWDTYVQNKTEREFQQMFRLDIDGFYEVLEETRHHYETKNLAQAWRKGAWPVSAEARLAMTLRWLAGGSHLDIKDVFLVSTAEFSATKLKVINAINDAYPVEFPASHEKQREIARKFANKSKSRCMQDCVGAVDGCIFTIDNPGKEVADSQRYNVPRKNKYGLLAQAICDADRRFLFFDITFPGSAHDMNHFRSTSIYGKMERRGFLAPGCYIIGDNAYTCLPWLLVMFIGSHPAGSMQDSYNWALSSLRMNIECAFGELIRRWGVLWRKLEVRHDRCASVIACCMRLHNICIDRRLQIESEYIRGDGCFCAGGSTWERAPRFENGSPVEYMSPNSSPLGGEMERGERRRQVAEAVNEIGVRRPPPRSAHHRRGRT